MINLPLRFLIAGALVAGTTLVALDSAEAQEQRGGRGRGLGNAIRGAAGALGVEIPRAQTEVLVPSAIGPQWAFLDEANPFASEDSRVDYLVTGVAQFDQYFREVAMLKGRLVLVRDTLAMVNQVLDSDLPQQLVSGRFATELLGDNASLQPGEQRQLVAALAGGNFARASRLAPSLAQDRFASIREEFLAENEALALVVPRLGPSAGALTGLADSVAGVIGGVQGMIDSAPSAFLGPQAAMVPDIVRNLRQSVNDLRDIGNLVGDLASQLADIVP
jgi:hypothetical protein